MSSRPAREGAQPSLVRAAYKAGWLTFASGDEKRRLAPIPEQWEDQSDDVLREWLGSAEVIKTLPK